MTNPRAPGGYVDERDVVWHTGGAADPAPRSDWRRVDRAVDTTRPDGWTTRVTLAVRLVDAFTGDRPRGDVRVALAGHDAVPVRNASGDAVFVDLDLIEEGSDRVELTVTADGGGYYADPVPEPVTLLTPDARAAAVANGESVFDPTRDAVEFELVPAPAYPFPAGTTLVRGRVRRPDGTRVTDALVSFEGVDRTTLTTAEGEYVLCFARDDPVTVVHDGDERVLRIDGTDPVVTAEDGTVSGESAPVRLPTGRTTVVDVDVEVVVP